VRRNYQAPRRQPGLAQAIVQANYARYAREQEERQAAQQPDATPAAPTAEQPARSAQQQEPTPNTGHHSPKCSINFGLAHCDCRDKGK